MSWTDEKIERLKELWDQGLSTAEIGRELGVSKNAVVREGAQAQAEAQGEGIESRLRRDQAWPPDVPLAVR